MGDCVILKIASVTTHTVCWLQIRMLGMIHRIGVGHDLQMGVLRSNAANKYRAEEHNTGTNGGYNFELGALATEVAEVREAAHTYAQRHTGERRMQLYKY